MTIFLKIDTVTLTLSQDPDIRTCSRYYHTQHLCEVILISINKYMHLSDDKSWTYLRRLCTYTLKNGTYPISARHLVLLWNKKKKKKANSEQLCPCLLKSSRNDQVNKVKKSDDYVQTTSLDHVENVRKISKRTVKTYRRSCTRHKLYILILFYLTVGDMACT